MNPLEQSPPQDVIQRVHEFARDLAYGVAQGFWDARFSSYSLRNEADFARLRTKWDYLPSLNLLLAFGYATREDQPAIGTTASSVSIAMYLLSERAFALLDKPSSAPSVFISYKRSESSAFGLLIEARLKLVGNPNPFIDKNLKPGDEWSADLQRHVQMSQYFICLIGPSTLESAHVQQELAWAEASNATIISVWHNGARMSESAPPFLQRRHAIRVVEENALGYESAVAQVLNALGYATY